MNDVDAMVMWMLIQGGMTARLYCEVAHMEMRCVLIGANEDLAGGSSSVAIFWAIGAYRYILPA